MQLESQIKQAEAELDTCRNTINELRQAIRDNGGARLDQIKVEIAQATKARQDKKKQHEDYLQLTLQCGLPTANTEQTFYRNLKSTEEKQEEMRKEREKLTTLQGSRIAEHLNTEQEIEIQKSEIESLQPITLRHIGDKKTIG